MGGNFFDGIFVLVIGIVVEEVVWELERCYECVGWDGNGFVGMDIDVGY